MLSERRKGLYLWDREYQSRGIGKNGYAYPLSISLGRQPRMYVSSVTKSAEKPAAFALDRIDLVMSFFSFGGQ